MVSNERHSHDVSTNKNREVCIDRIPDLYPRSNEDHLNGDSCTTRIELDPLIGSSVFDNVNIVGKHVVIPAFEELKASMAVIEKKFHSGQYDAQAMPLVEAFLRELKELARIQVERDSLRDQRLNDVKEANIQAFEAVEKTRHLREKPIEDARKAHLERISFLAETKKEDYENKKKESKERKERRRKIKEEKKARKDALKKRRRDEKNEYLESKRAAYHEKRKAAQAEKVHAHRNKFEEIQREWKLNQAEAEIELDRLKSRNDAERASIYSERAKAKKEIAEALKQVREADIEVNNLRSALQNEDKESEKASIDSDNVLEETDISDVSFNDEKSIEIQKQSDDVEVLKEEDPDPLADDRGSSKLNKTGDLKIDNEEEAQLHDTNDLILDDAHPLPPPPPPVLTSDKNDISDDANHESKLICKDENSSFTISIDMEDEDE